jgi:hypothetical protein
MSPSARTDQHAGAHHDSGARKWGGVGKDFCKGDKGNDTASGCEVETSI